MPIDGLSHTSARKYSYLRFIVTGKQMPSPISRRGVLFLGGLMFGLPGCTGDSNNSPPPTESAKTPPQTGESTTTSSPTLTPLETQKAEVSLLQIAIIEAENIDAGFEAPPVEQIKIGQEIAIFYKAEIPVRDGMYKAVITMDIWEENGPIVMEPILRHEGSADGGTTRITGYQRYPTKDFTPGKLSVKVSVSEELPGPHESEKLVVEMVAINEGENA